MHFIINQMMQLENMHVTEGYFTLKRFTSTTIVQRYLVFRWCHTELLRDMVRESQIQHTTDFTFVRAVKHRSCKWNTIFQVIRQFQDLSISKAVDIFRFARFVINLLQEFTQFFNFCFCFQHFADTQAQTFCCPAQMDFENLTNVHPRWNTQWVQHDVCWSTVGHVWHVFDRNDARNHTLITVTTRHFVTWLQATFNSQVNLDHFLYACWQLIALCQLGTFFFESQIELMTFLSDRIFHRNQCVRCFV